MAMLFMFRESRAIYLQTEIYLIRTFLNSAPRVDIILLRYTQLISILESYCTQFSYFNFLTSQAVEKINEMVVWLR